MGSENAETHCSHGKSYAEECPACDAISREEMIGFLVREAAKYGFKLVRFKSGNE
jgi:hypothetical protein